MKTSSRLHLRRGFTLLELILVMGLTLTVLAGAWPRLAGFSRARVLEAEAESVVALCRAARTAAVADCRVHRLAVNASERRCRVQVRDGAAWQTPAHPAGVDLRLPAGIEIELEALYDPQSDSEEAVIQFRPDGTADPARLTLTNAAGEILYVYALTALDDFYLTDDETLTRP